MNFIAELNGAIELDKKDPVKDFRSRFFMADENTIYLDGNSLGRLPIKTKELIDELMENQWGTQLIESWNKHWYRKSVELGDKLAKIIGASMGEVVISDSTSINLYKLAHAALKYNSDRRVVVSDVFNFPTDLYVLQGLCNDFDSAHKLVLAASKNDTEIDVGNLKKMITPDTALVTLSMVSFKSAYLYDAAEITHYAQQKGALVLWDLSHAAGAVPVELNRINADLAVGCTYKYLNGGPGSPAFLYVRKDLQEKLASPIQGWFGDAKPFAFDLEYTPAKGIHKFLAGTPPVLNQMAIEPGLDIILEAGVNNLYIKSKLLSEYFIFLMREKFSESGFKIGSPVDASQRGSHVSVKHKDAYRINQALIHPKNSTLKIIPDFREPDNIRFGFTPLYTTFVEVWKTLNRMKEIVMNKEFELYSNKRETVT